MVTKTDLDKWESEHGRIPDGAFVILRTGWSQFFHHPDKFFGNFADEDRQMFPGKHAYSCNLNHTYFTVLIIS